MSDVWAPLRGPGCVALHATEDDTVEGADDRPVDVPGQSAGVEQRPLLEQGPALVIGVDDELEPSQSAPWVVATATEPRPAKGRAMLLGTGVTKPTQWGVTMTGRPPR